MRSIYIILLMSLTMSGCKQEPRNVRIVDFSDSTPAVSPASQDPDVTPLNVAVSAILSPRETFSSYEDILNYISSRLDIPVVFHQRRTYGEINDMLEKGQLDFAFICSGAYTELNTDSGAVLLAVPVSNEKPFYQAYIIVPADSGAETLMDLKGLSFAYTDLLSNTGYLYALFRIKKEGQDPAGFFSSTIFTNAHDVSIQMVAKGLVDGATIDGLVFEYLKEKEPERVRDIRIIEVSDYFGIPPVVASSQMDGDVLDKVRDILFNMHMDEYGRGLINSILIDRFIEGDDSDYDGIRIMRAEVAD